MSDPKITLIPDSIIDIDKDAILALRRNAEAKVL